MKISWYVKDGDSEISLFASEGSSPVVGQTVYIRDNRNYKRLGTSIKYEVIRVDYSLDIEHLPFTDLSKEKRDNLWNDFYHPMEKELACKVFGLNVVNQTVEFSRCELQVLLKKI